MYGATYRKFTPPEVLRSKKEEEKAPKFFSFPSEGQPHKILMVFKQYDFKSLFGDGDSVGTARGLLEAPEDQFGRTVASTLKTTTSIELPFPKQLTDQTSLRVNNFERDPFVEQIATRVNNYIQSGGNGQTIGDLPKILQGMGAAVGSMLGGGGTSGGGGAMAQLQGALGNAMGTDIADVVTGAQYLLRKALPGDYARAVNNATGQVLNPRETLTFEGVNLRQHQFNWELFPNNPRDSDVIKNIVYHLKQHSLPQTANLFGINSAFLKYPSTVNLYLLGVNGEHFMKFKPAMIQNITVDYGPTGGVSIMRGGKPAAIGLGIQLSELEVETAHDYGVATPPPATARAETPPAEANQGNNNGTTMA
jgi:hypothetical protein